MKSAGSESPEEQYGAKSPDQSISSSSALSSPEAWVRQYEDQLGLGEEHKLMIDVNIGTITALHVAIYRGNVEQVSNIMRSLNQADDSWLILMTARLESVIDRPMAMLADKNGCSPKVTPEVRLAMARLVLGIEANDPLSANSRQVFLQFRNANDSTPLDLALVGEFYELAKLFLECGADPRKKSDKTGENALMKLARQPEMSDVSCLVLLWDHLHLGKKNSSLPFMQIDPSVAAVNNKNESVFQIAVDAGNFMLFNFVAERARMLLIQQPDDVIIQAARPYSRKIWLHQNLGRHCDLLMQALYHAKNSPKHNVIIEKLLKLRVPLSSRIKVAFAQRGETPKFQQIGLSSLLYAQMHGCLTYVTKIICSFEMDDRDLYYPYKQLIQENQQLFNDIYRDEARYKIDHLLAVVQRAVIQFLVSEIENQQGRVKNSGNLFGRLATSFKKKTTNADALKKTAIQLFLDLLDVKNDISDERPNSQSALDRAVSLIKKQLGTGKGFKVINEFNRMLGEHIAMHSQAAELCGVADQSTVKNSPGMKMIGALSALRVGAGENLRDRRAHGSPFRGLLKPKAQDMIILPDHSSDDEMPNWEPTEAPEGADGWTTPPTSDDEAEMGGPVQREGAGAYYSGSSEDDLDVVVPKDNGSSL